MKMNGVRKMTAATISSEWLATASRKRLRRTAHGRLRRTSVPAATGTLAVLNVLLPRNAPDAKRLSAKRTSGGGLGGPGGAPRRGLRPRRGCSSNRSRVVNPPPRIANDQDGDRERDHEQEHGQRRCVAHVEELESVLVQQHGIEQRRALRIAEVVDGLVAGL